MLGIQIPSVALKHLIPNFYVFQSLTCSQLLQGTPGSLMKMLLVLPKMIFSFIEEIRPRRRERKVQVCWQNVREMNKAGSFFPISGFSPETEDPITCSSPAAPSQGFTGCSWAGSRRGQCRAGQVLLLPTILVRDAASSGEQGCDEWLQHSPGMVRSTPLSSIQRDFNGRMSFLAGGADNGVDHQLQPKRRR